MPGLEIEFTRNGIELDNLSLSALLKLCFLTGMTGMATGVYVGLQAGAAWFTEDKVKKRQSQNLATFACYAMTGASFVVTAFLYWTHSSGERGGGGRRVRN